MPRKATGQLVWCKSGWRGRYWATVDGERQQVFRDLETHNKAIARKRLDELCAAGSADAPLVETFERAAMRVNEVRARTLAGAKVELGFLRKHAFPVIGGMLVTVVTKADVLSVLEAVRDAGKSDQTILHVRNAVAAVYRQLRREGVVSTSPAPSGEEVPESLPEAIDDRPKAVLSDEELLVALAYTEPRTGYRGAVRERQMMALLSRCVGGMRTAELSGLTWARARAEGGSFDALEVVRYKTRRKAIRRGSKAVARQLYPLGDTVLPFFLRYWWLRCDRPEGDALLFPVRRPKTVANDRTGQRRIKSSWAKAFRRDVQEAFEAAHSAGNGQVAAPGSRRWQELFAGTEDRKPLWFHNSRNMAAIVAERFERLKAAAKFTGHASGRMLQHYREMAGEVDVVPLLPELLPDASTLVAILRDWCAADEIDPALVFGPPEPPDENTMRKHNQHESPQIAAQFGWGAPDLTAGDDALRVCQQRVPKLAHYQAVLHPEGA